MWVRRRGRYYLYRTQDVQVRPWWSGSGGGVRTRAEDIIEAPASEEEKQAATSSAAAEKKGWFGRTELSKSD